MSIYIIRDNFTLDVTFETNVSCLGSVELSFFQIGNKIDQWMQIAYKQRQNQSGTKLFLFRSY